MIPLCRPSRINFSASRWFLAPRDIQAPRKIAGRNSFGTNALTNSSGARFPIPPQELIKAYPPIQPRNSSRWPAALNAALKANTFYDPSPVAGLKLREQDAAKVC